MKLKSINVLRNVWILIGIFYSSLLWAQPYAGGNNSGAIASNTTGINCTANRFLGGDGDGNTVFITNTLDCVASRFSGDSADGSTSIKTDLTDCTTSRFFGDTTDGSASMATNTLNCMPMRFFGDTADGAASGSALKARHFLEDTSIILICSDETFNMLSLYNTTGYVFNWGTPTPATAPIGSYTISAVSSSGCKDTATALITQQIARWTGAVSDDWHTAANWSINKIPDEITHVIIPAGATNVCRISTADAKAASVQVKSANGFSIINNRILLISGTCTGLPPN